jgi:hypothetical protein
MNERYRALDTLLPLRIYGYTIQFDVCTIEVSEAASLATFLVIVTRYHYRNNDDAHFTTPPEHFVAQRRQLQQNFISGDIFMQFSAISAARRCYSCHARYLEMALRLRSPYERANQQ